MPRQFHLCGVQSDMQQPLKHCEPAEQREHAQIDQQNYPEQFHAPKKCTGSEKFQTKPDSAGAEQITAVFQ